MEWIAEVTHRAKGRERAEGSSSRSWVWKVSLGSQYAIWNIVVFNTYIACQNKLGQEFIEYITWEISREDSRLRLTHAIIIIIFLLFIIYFDYKMIRKINGIYSNVIKFNDTFSVASWLETANGGKNQWPCSTSTHIYCVSPTLTCFMCIMWPWHNRKSTPRGVLKYGFWFLLPH